MKRKRIEEFVVSLENDQITKDESALVLGGNSGWFDKKKETNNCGCTNVSPCNSTVTNNCACENVSKPNLSLRVSNKGTSHCTNLVATTCLLSLATRLMR